MLLGVSAAVVASGAAGWYAYTVVRGRTRPHRVTFAVWTLIGALGVSSALEAGAGPGAYAAIVYAAVTAFVFLVSLVPGFGKPNAERRSDWLLGLVSCATLLAWSVTTLPTAAAATVAVGAEAAIAWPTIREAWRQPRFEAAGPWLLGSVGCCMALAAVERFSYASASYPAFIALQELTVAFVLVARSRALPRLLDDDHHAVRKTAQPAARPYEIVDPVEKSK